MITKNPCTNIGASMTTSGQRISRFRTAHWSDTTVRAPTGVVRSCSSSPVRRDSTKNRLAAQANKDPITAAEASPKDHETAAIELGPENRTRNAKHP